MGASVEQPNCGKITTSVCRYHVNLSLRANRDLGNLSSRRHFSFASAAFGLVYRSSGEQTMRVEHVTVNEGGQAIVGNVTHGRRGPSVKTEPSS